MTDLGGRLKRAREARGIDLHEIASATKISVAALEALERNDFSRLPGGIFSRSFVRAYALAVGLDPETTVSEFLVELHHSEREAERNARKPEITADDRAFLDRQQRAVRNLRLGLVVLGVIVAAGLLYAAWAWWPRAAGRDDPAASVAAPAPSQPPIPSEPSASLPVTVVPPPAEVPALAPAVPAQLSIAFDFTADCWMAVVADGVLDVRRQFRNGERHEVRARAEVVLNVGNAGGFRWSINGRAARALGQEGTIREVRVTTANYTSFLESGLAWRGPL